MRSLPRVLALLLIASLVLGVITPAFAAAPPSASTPMNVIPAEGFEGAYPASLTVEAFYPISASTAWWAPISFIHHGGSKALWCAGSTAPTVWPSTYPLQSGGRATFSIPSMSDYYSAKLTFYYSMPSLGDDDSNAFLLSWWDSRTTFGAATYYGPGHFPLTTEGGWNKSEWNLASPSDVNLSRKPAEVRFQWYDAEETFGQSNLSGEGPSIDDVSITGYKYGPIRSLTATRSGGNVMLSWAKPPTSTSSSANDTRTIAYRVWRYPDSTPTGWTELTPTPRSTSLTFTDTSPLQVPAHYFVQAWDTGSGTGYGEPGGSSVAVAGLPDNTKPVTTITGVPGGWSTSNVTFSLSATDEGWGLASTHYRFNGGQAATYTAPVQVTGEGTTTISYWSVDQANNTEVAKTAPARIDKTKPVTTASIAYGIGSAIVTLHPTDAVSGVAATHYTLDGGAPQTGASILIGTVGEHTITYWSRDVAGNNEVATSQQVTVSNFVTDSVEGPTRFETANEAVGRAFPTGSSTVVIAWGRNFPDALGAAALCGAYDAPLLLTETNDIPPAVSAKITQLGANHAVIIGSRSVVSQAAADELATLVGGPTHVDRIDGPGRYDTAKMVAGKVAELAGARDDVFLAVGDNFPDALAASPAAFAYKWPIVLTTRTALSPQAIESLSSLAPDRVHILGSTGAVPAAVEAQLRTRFPSITVDRWQGPTRYATAVDIANRSGLPWTGIGIATGENFPDALAGGVMQGKLTGPVLLTPTSSLHPNTEAAILAHKPEISTVRYLGSSSAVGTAVRTKVSQILQ